MYMDIPLKPNILEDISRERLPPLPPGNYASKSDKIMLEDESGRIQLVGAPIQFLLNEDEGDEQVNVNANKGKLTGVILAPASSEKREDDDVEMAPPETDTKNDTYLAFVPGLSINLPSPSDARTQLLIKYLCGELATTGEDFIPPSQIPRLVVCGNSLAPVILTGKGEADADGIRRGIKEKKKMIGTRIAKGRLYGYDSTTFSPHPTRLLSSHFLDLTHVMPVHILPGEPDPAGTILPQQPFPKGMFGAVGAYDSLSCETNPAWLKVKEGKEKEKGNERTFLIHSGQPLNDMFKYLPVPPPNSTLPTLPSSTGPTSSFPFSFPSLNSSSQHSSNTPNSPSIPPNNLHALTKLSLMHSTLHWRHIAPTTPNTLWCHPYFDPINDDRYQCFQGQTEVYACA